MPERYRINSLHAALLKTASPDAYPRLTRRDEYTSQSVEDALVYLEAAGLVHVEDGLVAITDAGRAVLSEVDL